MYALEVVKVVVIPHCGVTVTFSDGTFADYVADELVDLRPNRELSHELKLALKLD